MIRAIIAPHLVPALRDPQRSETLARALKGARRDQQEEARRRAEAERKLHEARERAREMQVRFDQD